MPITREEVRHIATLARLRLTDEEEAAFTDQLDHILAYFERLRALNTDTVEPTAHVTPMATPFRDDRVENVPAAEALVGNAPARDGNLFKVPKIIE